MMEAQLKANVFRETIQHHSKSFAFASKLIPPDVRGHVEVLYAWCRHVDDAIDLAELDDQGAVLIQLHAELDAIYSDQPCTDDTLVAMRHLVNKFEIPRLYAEDLIAGMEMDVQGVVYQDLDTLLLYCYRVAGTVGLMMGHVLGVRQPAALENALHLGIGMQLTNICRDVHEDWARNRLYIPHDILTRHGADALPASLGSGLHPNYREALAASVGELLDLADRYYKSGDRGMYDLSFRTAFAVRAARRIYAQIGAALRERDCDVLSGRVYVSKSEKYRLALRALVDTALEIPFRAVNRFSRASLPEPLHYSHDVHLPEGEE